jgi:hypothetical protein
MKEVQEKLLPGELGVSPIISLLIYFPPRLGAQGVDYTAWQHALSPVVLFFR